MNPTLISEFDAKRLAVVAAIVDSSDDAILSKNLDGIITSWNLGAKRMFGYNAEEIIGKSILTLIPQNFIPMNRSSSERYAEESASSISRP